jgi:hypothetical protein
MTYQISTVQAVAATNTHLDASPPLARADVSSPPPSAADAASSARQHPRFLSAPVPGIDPVDGWAMRAFGDGGPGCGSWDEYIARGADRDVMLRVSRWSFTPTQERFAWLVRAGFPNGVQRPGGCITSICDSDIDAAIAAGAAA